MSFEDAPVKHGEKAERSTDGEQAGVQPPPGQVRRTFVLKEDLLEILRVASLDPGFQADIDDAFGATTDELFE